MPLPTNRTTANTAQEHVDDHNTLHGQHNSFEGTTPTTFIQADGSVAATADISMGSNKLTNVTDGSASGDAVNKGQLDGKAASTHATAHESGGGDELTGNLDANARVTVRVDGGADVGPRRRVNLIAGTNISSITAVDDSLNEEVDVTINATAGADATAIHTDGVGEIDSLTEVGSIGVGDYLMVETGASSLDKRKIEATNLPTAPVNSVFGRSGAVVAAASDYDASQIDNDSGVSGSTVAAALDTLEAHAHGDNDYGSDVLAASGTSLTVSSIPSGATDLLITVVARSDNVADVDDLRLRVGNGSVDTGSNYRFHQYQRGAPTDIEDVGSGSAFITIQDAVPAFNSNSGEFGIIQILIKNYASTTQYKKIMWQGGHYADSGTPTYYSFFGNGTWRNNTQAIDVVQVYPGNGTNLFAESEMNVYALPGPAAGGGSGDLPTPTEIEQVVIWNGTSYQADHDMAAAPKAVIGFNRGTLTSLVAKSRHGGIISQGPNHDTVMQEAMDYVQESGGGGLGIPDQLYTGGTFYRPVISAPLVAQAVSEGNSPATPIGPVVLTALGRARTSAGNYWGKLYGSVIEADDGVTWTSGQPMIDFATNDCHGCGMIGVGLDGNSIANSAGAPTVGVKTAGRKISIEHVPIVRLRENTATIYFYCVNGSDSSGDRYVAQRFLYCQAEADEYGRGFVVEDTAGGSGATDGRLIGFQSNGCNDGGVVIDKGGWEISGGHCTGNKARPSAQGGPAYTFSSDCFGGFFYADTTEHHPNIEIASNGVQLTHVRIQHNGNSTTGATKPLVQITGSRQNLDLNFRTNTSGTDPASVYGIDSDQGTPPDFSRISFRADPTWFSTNATFGPELASDDAGRDYRVM